MITEQEATHKITLSGNALYPYNIYRKITNLWIFTDWQFITRKQTQGECEAYIQIDKASVKRKPETTYY